jgi:hypothetical protein
MVRKSHILFVVGIGLLVLTPIAAQEEQWLQYHSARELGLLVSAQPQPLEISTEKPPGVELPQFKAENPLFAKWSTPMVTSGYLWVALDRTHKQSREGSLAGGPYDLLYIDSNGNGRLADETAVAAYRTDQYSAYFGPVKVMFELQDGPATYHLNLRYYGYDDASSRLYVSSGAPMSMVAAALNDRSRRLYASSGGWYQGDITLGSQKKHCILFDYNANGTFNDKSANAAECDRVRIGQEGGQDASFVGNYIEVDGALYRPEIARDGACVKLTKAQDVKFGAVRLPESVTQISANGQNGLFIRKSEKGVASLPVGQYRIYDWIIGRQDDKGTEWRLQGSGAAAKNAFDVTEGNETALSFGEPIVATLDASADKGTHSFRYTLQGRDGERIELTRNGAQPQAPKVRIRSADGAYDRTYSFSYG